MAIQIIDGFQVNTALPIDNRIVASGSVARNAIPYKYHGLRVFDISNNIPYVWNGTSWVSENASGIAGSGTSTFFPLFTSSNVVADSFLYQDGGIIKTGDDGGGADLVQISPYYGSVVAQGGFYGPGTSITNISGSNINSGSIPPNRLVNGSTGQVLISSVTNPFWSNTSQLSVGTASVANNVGITNTTTNSSYYLAFVANGSWTSIPGASTNLLSDNTGILYNPSTNQLSGISLLNVAIGSAAAPSISFTGDTNTGIYSSGANSLSVTLNGAESVKFETSAVTFGSQANNYPRIKVASTSSATAPSFTWWGNDQTGIFRPAANVVAISTGSAGVERARFTDNGTSIGFGTAIKAMYVGRIRFTKTGTSAGSVTVISGGDYTGTSYTINNQTYNTTTVTARINFPTAMPSSNIVVVCHIDSTSANHYPWTVICSDRSTSYITLVCLQQDAASWSTGSVDGSFVAYSIL